MAIAISKLYGKDAKALTKTPNQAIQLVSVDFDSSYPTGGETFTYDQPIVHMWHLEGGKYAYKYNRSTGKIQAFKPQKTFTGGTDGTADGALEDTNGAVTGVDGMSSNAASKVDVDARLVALTNNTQELIAGAEFSEVAAATNLSGETGILFAVLVDHNA